MSHYCPGAPVNAQRIMSIAFGTVIRIFFVVNINTSNTKKLQIKQDKDEFPWEIGHFTNKQVRKGYL